MTAGEIFSEVPSVEKQLWGGEFWQSPKLRRADQLLLTLMCWRDCRTEYWPCFIASAGRLCAGRRMIKKIENTMIKSEQFHLPCSKDIQSGRMDIEIILVDASEHPIERPQKKQLQCYSGKKV
ncbi:hypothetical protein VU07_01710 [Desulfobulbus sp. F4]|nr:hypothetical protein [Desulfobulbus sp. F4]